jgi:hypothetical protein
LSLLSTFSDVTQRICRDSLSELISSNPSKAAASKEHSDNEKKSTDKDSLLDIVASHVLQFLYLGDVGIDVDTDESWDEDEQEEEEKTIHEDDQDNQDEGGPEEGQGEDKGDEDSEEEESNIAAAAAKPAPAASLWDMM